MTNSSLRDTYFGNLRVFPVFDVDSGLFSSDWCIFSYSDDFGEDKPFDLSTTFEQFVNDTSPSKQEIFHFFRQFAKISLQHIIWNLEFALEDLSETDSDGDERSESEDSYFSLGWIGSSVGWLGENFLLEQLSLLIETRKKLIQQIHAAVTNNCFLETQEVLRDSGIGAWLDTCRSASLLAQLGRDSFDWSDSGESDYYGSEDQPDNDGIECPFSLNSREVHDNKQANAHRDRESHFDRDFEDCGGATPAPGRPKLKRAQTFEDIEARRVRKAQRYQRFWESITISRDETSASNFMHERLALLFSKEPGRNHGLEDHQSTEGTARTLSEISNSSAFTVEEHSNSLVSSDIPERTLAERSEFGNINFRSPKTTEVLIETITECDIQLEDMSRGRIEDKMVEKGIPAQPGASSQASVNEHFGEDADYHQLLDRISILESENRSLKHPRTDAVSEKWKIIYFVPDDHQNSLKPYFDAPVWTPGWRHDEFNLKAMLPVTDLDGYINKERLDFVVVRYYSIHPLMGELRRALANEETLPEPKHSQEYIHMKSARLIQAAQQFFSAQPNFSKDFLNFQIKQAIPSPYMFWYMYRSTEALDCVDLPYLEPMRLLTGWIEDTYKDRYEFSKRCLDRGVVTLSTMPFLFQPGDVVVWKEKDEWNASVCRRWPSQTSSPIIYWNTNRTDWTAGRVGGAILTETKQFSTTWEFESWKFHYDGSFKRDISVQKVVFKASSLDEEVRIAKLNIYPLKFADEEVKSLLEERGRRFWRCRYRNFVSHSLDGGLYGGGERFMVDYEIYKEIHGESKQYRLPYRQAGNDEDPEQIDSEEMKSDEPPTAPEIYVFPTTIPGFNMRSKKWVDLKVDLITDVVWNMDAFQHLVMEEQTKELVHALVNHHIESERGTDIIHRKGNGLIILLHGGPGTGKTFTAESVAEIARKPLYCVTCGDIGTNPEQAEKYLESVLYLGKTWGCVVLIDEAEVFLEQRSTDTLDRNALVSVFLRVLEYYEGIMILTTNRVGTFDEAFKSRILLSLHYEALRKPQRKKIWRNFIERLKKLEDLSTPKLISGDSTDASSSVTDGQSTKDRVADMDYQDVLDYLDDLSEHALNGRQIRNIITTARQLAKFRKEIMKYKHIQEVIAVSSKFDEYLRKVKDNLSDDQIAREDQLR